MDPARLGYLLVAITTHALLAYALVHRFTGADPRLGPVFALLPDLDLLFPEAWPWPFVHRGLTHAPLTGGAFILVIYLVTRDRSVTAAATLAIASHLAIDALSPRGIDWVFPFVDTGGPGVAVHGPLLTPLWLALAATLLLSGSERGLRNR